ncbi:6-phospho-3-hexuloisomerase [Nonomuraea candida]|uniref:6-phospho-3-hexuloisomerase n=1 Tax=Nonomuraea candida TaxID=359159 RepID=UPI00069431DF|nr:6-phospho-3-hexuloisomerase [Nonomuraea candida]
MIGQSGPVEPGDPAVTSTEALFGQSLHRILGAVQDVLGRASPAGASALIHEVLSARNVYVTGAGRSGMAVESFAMRLMHLGLAAHVAGAATTPSIGPGDLLVACSGSGERPTVLVLAETAKEAGARLTVVTSAGNSPLARLADLVIRLSEGPDGYDTDDTGQFMGTLFEQAAYLFFDGVVLTVQKLAAIDTAQMRQRHTNLE